MKVKREVYIKVNIEVVDETTSNEAKAALIMLLSGWSKVYQEKNKKNKVDILMNYK